MLEDKRRRADVSFQIEVGQTQICQLQCQISCDQFIECSRHFRDSLLLYTKYAFTRSSHWFKTKIIKL